MCWKAPTIFLFIVFIVICGVETKVSGNAISYQTSTMDSRLVAHWKMDESSGSIVSDVGENNLNATLSSAAGSTWISGVYDGALYLDGNDQDARISSPGKLGSLSSITIAAHVKCSTSDAWGEWIAAHGDNYGLYIKDQGLVRFYFYDGSDWPGFSSATNVRDNNWHHIAATFNHLTGIVNIYVDGKLERSSDVSGTISFQLGSEFTIGSMQSARFFKGSIDDLRVYDTVLSDEEILQIQQNVALIPPPEIFKGQPEGYLPLGTSHATIRIETNVEATCKYDMTPGLPYSEMSHTFSTSGDTLHSDVVTGLENFKTYTYYCKCKDNEGLENLSDYNISFSVDTLLPLELSDIPLVVITTEGGAPIVDEPKTKALMKVIDNGPGQINSVTDPGTDYNGFIGIEIRGAYSASLPQKPYLLETRTDSGTNNNVSLLGMPEENDWILQANYNDKAFVRNSMAFEIFRNMGHYATRTRYCEVFINNDYRGIYLLSENIKRDKNRVDIAKLEATDTIGDQLTGGYIIKTDYHSDSNSWRSNYPPFVRPSSTVYHVYQYPKANEIVSQQKDYISSFMDSFEAVMHSSNYDDRKNGYEAYIDVNSFIDYFLITELSRNVDGYKKSRYFYKDRESRDGKLYSGPAWDFDWAWKNIYDCPVYSRTDGSGWSWEAGKDCNQDVKPPVYVARLLEDTLFQNRLKTRYVSFREYCLSFETLFGYLDSAASYLNQAQRRHYERWGHLGEDTGSPEVEPAPDTFEGELDKLRDWITLRISWLDANMPGHLIPDLPDNVESFLAEYRIFPNPASEVLYVESDRIIKHISIISMSGSVMYQTGPLHTFSQEINVGDLTSGIYLLKIDSESGSSKLKKIMIRN